MATAIIRAVVVASSCRQNVHDYISTTNCQQVKSASSSKTSSPLKPAQYPQPSVAKDETFILATCLCQTQLPKDQQQQSSLSTTYWLTDHSIESFSTANISASTAIVGTKENEVGVLSNVTSSNNNNSTTSVALGALKHKQSPLFGRKSLSNSRSFSLRSEQPFYVRGKCLQTLSLSADIEKQRQLQQQQRQLHLNNNVDHTALEAITMNYTASNGPRNATNSRNIAMDINRNNGYTLNGSIMTATAEKREHLYKILVIGELGTGKTSFIKRYVHQFFSQNYRATIGVDFALKVLHWDANTIVRLQLWDIAGQERFGNMTRVYYKEAVGAFIVFDVTRSGTFDCVSKWKEDLDSKVQLPDGSPIPCILLANKCDQDKQGIVATPEKMDEYVRENGFAGWFETSAKENVNIDEAARALVNKILLNDKLISASDLADSEKFNLNNSADQTATETKSKCSC